MPYLADRGAHATDSSAALFLGCKRLAPPRFVTALSLIGVQDLKGRVAGRNSDDAEQSETGLAELQTQWKSYEQSTAQVCKIQDGWSRNLLATKGTGSSQTSLIPYGAAVIRFISVCTSR